MKKLIFLSLMAIAIQSQAQNVGINTATPNYQFTVLKDGTGIAQTSSDGLVEIVTRTNSVPNSGWFGTNTKVPMHFGTYGNSDISIMINGKVGIGVTTPVSAALLEVAGQVKINGGYPEAGKILVTDANGLASWQNSTKYTTITPGCSEVFMATNTYSKVTDIGAFLKDNTDTKIELNMQSSFSISTLSASYGVVFELRVDDLPTTNGNARALIGYQQINNTSIFGLFTNLTQGYHTVSIWARALTISGGTTGTASNFYVGCNETANLTVKETF